MSHVRAAVFALQLSQFRPSSTSPTTNRADTSLAVAERADISKPYAGQEDHMKFPSPQLAILCAAVAGFGCASDKGSPRANAGACLLYTSDAADERSSV